MERIEKTMVINTLENIRSFLNAVQNHKLDKKARAIWAEVKQQEIDAIVKTLNSTEEK